MNSNSKFMAISAIGMTALAAASYRVGTYGASRTLHDLGVPASWHNVDSDQTLEAVSYACCVTSTSLAVVGFGLAAATFRRRDILELPESR